MLKANKLPYADVPVKLDSIFLSRVDSKVVGIGGIELHGRYGLLRSLAIASPFRGKGYGRMFVRELIEHARTKGIEEIYLLTTTATSFFAKIGFEKVDRHIVPPAIQNTSQFVSLCPDSATCLRQVLLQRSL